MLGREELMHVLQLVGYKSNFQTLPPPPPGASNGAWAVSFPGSHCTCSMVLMDPCGLGRGPTLPYSQLLEGFFKTDRISKNIEPNIAKIRIQGFDIKDENQWLSKR